MIDLVSIHTGPDSPFGWDDKFDMFTMKNSS
jgi:hypothetical protein